MNSRTAKAVTAILIVSVAPAGEPAAVETRTFELREYFVAPGKLEALHARFRDGTIRLMERHGISGIGYFVSDNDQDDVLRVILAYPDTHARTRAWDSFVNDPDWHSLRRRTESEGRLVEKIREYPMNPTPDCPRVVANRSLPEGWVFQLQFSNGNRDTLPRGGEVVELIGSWQINHERPCGEPRVVKLVARQVTPIGEQRVALFRPAPLSTDPTRPTAGPTPPTVVSGVRDVMPLRPTDYSPFR